MHDDSKHEESAKNVEIQNEFRNSVDINFVALSFSRFNNGQPIGCKIIETIEFEAVPRKYLYDVFYWFHKDNVIN